MNEYPIIIIGLTLLPILMGLQRFANSYGYDYQTKEQAINNAKFAFKVGCMLSIIGFLMLIAGCNPSGEISQEDLGYWMQDCFDKGGTVYMVNDEKLGRVPACSVAEKGKEEYKQ